MRVQEAAELVAIDVFQRAEATGQPITVGLVERRLDELRSHKPECASGLLMAVMMVPFARCGGTPPTVTEVSARARMRR